MPTNQATQDERPDLPTIQKVVAVLWPSFITAGLATILFFTLFDPIELSLIAGGPEVTRLGGYTIGFFLFWLLTSVSCALTCYFRRPCTPKHYPKEGEDE